LQLTNFAVTIIKTANKIGLNVPKDLAVIAFTDGIISKYFTPTITTASQSKMGNKAAKMLMKDSKLKMKRTKTKTEVIETHLIERESTN
jgi:LacI family transcriptional regulator